MCLSCAHLEVRIVDAKASLGVLPGHSPDRPAAKPGKCPGGGSKPPSSSAIPAGHCAGSSGVGTVLHHGCASDEGSADSSSQVQYRNTFLTLKMKGKGSRLEGTAGGVWQGAG